MAQYSVKTGPLSEAGEEFLMLAGDFGRHREGLDSMLSRWPEGLSGLRRQLTKTKESIYEISKKTRSTGMVLHEITDHYTRAERSAISGHVRDLNRHATGQQLVPLPSIRSSSGAVMFERTVMPDWLQIAVLEYEQSQG